MDKKTMLKFVPFQSCLEPSFWYKFSEMKIETIHLDESAVPIAGTYTNGDPPKLPSRFSLSYESFNNLAETKHQEFRCSGELINFNTLEAFKKSNKTDLLEEVGRKVWQDVKEGRTLSDPTLINRFLLISYADLKKHHFYYWFGFPAFSSPPKCSNLKVHSLQEYFTEAQAEGLMEAYKGVEEKRFFIVSVDSDKIECLALKDRQRKEGRVVYAFSDPSTLDQHPGWPLRNYLAFICYHWGDLHDTIDVLCYRQRSSGGTTSISHSLVITVKIEDVEKCRQGDLPKVVGWEQNQKGNLTPRFVDLSSSMDPIKLAESAVDLNLKLMRWRLLPSLDLKKIESTRCLLLGAGTLGCNVARSLMGWGMKHITFVDNGKVSYSNPVRQSLFVFDDCVSGRAKADAAVEGLRRIFPGVNSSGVCLTIPMPGHVVSKDEEETVKKTVARIDELIKEHDVVFLLTDSRESRWLPTVIGATHNKLVMNAALGFDSYLVMRHGVKLKEEEGSASSGESLTGDQLGCYFCNDVVAPRDSLSDRTLDQACTLTRPGLSMVASGLLVELAMSTLQHPKGGLSPAPLRSETENSEQLEGPLGLVPHSMRGFLSQARYMTPTTQAFDSCTACSKKVINAYVEEGWSFLLNVFNTPRYLEEITGLASLTQDLEDDDGQMWELDSDTEDGEKET